MSVEIERKFLVASTNFIAESHQKLCIKQGFLSTHKDRVVRVRVQDETGFLTIKGRSNSSGTTRFEWEKEIALTEANQLLLLCEKEVIEKERYLVRSNEHVFEVDVFLGVNAGLIVAEIELSAENEVFAKPTWLGKEVTGDVRYYNASLSKTPYTNW